MTLNRFAWIMVQLAYWRRVSESGVRVRWGLAEQEFEFMLFPNQFAHGFRERQALPI